MGLFGQTVQHGVVAFADGFILEINGLAVNGSGSRNGTIRNIHPQIGRLMVRYQLEIKPFRIVVRVEFVFDACIGCGIDEFDVCAFLLRGGETRRQRDVFEQLAIIDAFMPLKTG